MRWSTRLIAFAVGAASLGAAAVGCTLLTDFRECEITADCVERHGPRATCGPDFVCSVASTVTTEQCQRTIGEVGSQTFLIGVLLPLTGPEAGFGVPLLRAIETALSNFSSLEVEGRKVALLVCDTEGVDEVALEAGRQAIEEARVTAIIGPDFSSQTLDIANEYAIPNEVLLVTPSGTSTQITTLDDDNLVWRTAPSDVAQADALGQLVTAYITKTLNKDLSETVVWLLNRSEDSYGVGLQEALVSDLPQELTASANFKPSQYPSDWEDSWFSGTALQLPPPDVVLLMGAAESWAMAEAIDDAFPENDPVFLFADAARNPDEAAKTAAALEGRVLGTAPQSVGDLSYTPYTNFRIKYQSDHREDPNDLQFVANAYDALHVVVLAAAAGGGISGPELAVGMSELSAGEKVTANSQGASAGIQILADGGTIDFEGASGRLDFDENGDPSPSKIVLWCFREAGVPEVGDLLTTDGQFQLLDCAGDGAVNNGTPDMGESDMGADAGGDAGGADTGTSTDMDAANG